MTVRLLPQPGYPVRGDHVRFRGTQRVGLVLSTDTTQGSPRCQVLLDGRLDAVTTWASDLEITNEPVGLPRAPHAPHASSVSLAEDPADTLATPFATSATPDTAPPVADPAPEAGAASAHDAAPATDLAAYATHVLGITLHPWQRRWLEGLHASARRAEGSESPRLVTDAAEDGSDTDTSLPIVGGRAVPPVPAPADITNPDGLADWELELLPPATESGATSVHDAAPVTDLAALRDATYRLRDVRAEIDSLLDVERALATRVSEGLGSLVGVPVDLNWGAEPAGSAS